MKKGNVNLFVFTICVLVLLSAVAQAQDLKLEISLSKEIYLEGEPIWLDCWLTNIGDDTLRTWGLCL